MAIGDNIRKARKSAQMTQKMLGDALNVSPQMIAQYENGVRQPKIETIQKIAAALGIKVYDLIDGGFGALDAVLPLNMQGVNLDGAKIDIDFLNILISNFLRLPIEYPNYNRTKENILALAASSGLEEYAIQALEDASTHYIPVVRERTISYGMSNKEALLKRISSYLELLSKYGQEEAVRRVEELTQLPQYTKPSEE